MKITHLTALVLAALCTACQSDTPRSAAVQVDSSGSVAPDTASLIVAGKALGAFRLKQDMQTVTTILGEPDAGDAAMGKAWGIWYEKDPSGGQKSEIAIYSSYKDSTMMAKDVKQIRTTVRRFKTTEGLGIGSTLSDFMRAYPDLKLQARYSGGSSDTISLYDSESRGIAVEFVTDTCRAINVHPAGTRVTESYFTYDPALKKIDTGV